MGSSERRLSLPPNTEEEWQATLERRKDLKNFMASHPVPCPVAPRINQWDAARLDEELLDLLKKQASKAYPELTNPMRDVCLELMYHICSVGRGVPTPGMQLLNVMHVPTGHFDMDAKLSMVSRGMLVLLSTLRGAYVAHSTKLHPLETMARALELLQKLAFVGGSRHRGLVERMAGVELRQARSDVGRVVSFTYMHRILAWQALSSFLLFLAPLVDATAQRVARVVRDAKRKERRRRAMDRRLDEREAVEDSDAWMKTVCPVCGYEDPPLTYCALPCKHLYCYTCLMANCMRDGSHGYECTVCGELVRSIQQHVRMA